MTARFRVGALLEHAARTSTVARMKKGEAILELRFFGHDKPLTARAYGQYARSDDTKTPYVLPSISVLKQEFRPRLGNSVARIVEIGGGKVCGTFELKGRGGKVHLTGSFLAKTSE